jgi:uncharacterized membrane-anchored protein
MSTTPRRERYRSRTPSITALFWVTRVATSIAGSLLATAMTERLGVGTILLATATAVVLLVQFAVARYVPALFWLTVLTMSVFGVMAVNDLTDVLELSPATAAAVLAVLLIGAFTLWHATEKTLSLRTVDTTRREFFYWLTALLTVALGTAAERLGHATFGLGYATLAVAGAALTVAAWAARRLPVLAFWLAYAFTQPLGTALADLTARPRDAGGLGLGTGAATSAALAVAAAAVLYSGITHHDDPSLEYATRHIGS